MIRIYTVDSDGYKFDLSGIQDQLKVINDTILLETEARELHNSMFLYLNTHNLVVATVTLAKQLTFVEINGVPHQLCINTGGGGIFYGHMGVNETPIEIENTKDRDRLYKQAKHQMISKMIYLILRDSGYTTMADNQLKMYNRDAGMFTTVWQFNENESLKNISFEVIDNK